MKLIEYLKENNMTILSFANKIDYTREHISKVANGKSIPSEKMKRQIHKATKGVVTFD
jgi:transcriptional regulator with XRE-family HTH domain